MTGDRNEAAVQRIEAALARIARVAENPPQAIAVPAPTASVFALVEKHEALRETVAHVIEEIDAVIADLDQ